MRKLKIIILALVVIGFLIGTSILLVKYFRPKPTGIFIDSKPASNVFVNSEQVGRTPYRTNKLDPGEYSIRLIPDSYEVPLAPYDTKINLQAKTETIIKKEFGKTPEESSIEVDSFEKLDSGETGISIVTVPEKAQIVIDGSTRALSPYKTMAVVPGEHSITLSLDGYIAKNLKVNTYSGYRLVIYVEFKKSKEEVATPTPTPTPQEEVKDMVEILSTPLGYLRVRKDPTTEAVEIGKAEPGKLYPLLETDEASGCFKIEYEQGKSGWIANQYAKKVTPSITKTPSQTITQTPTPTPKLSPKPSI